MVCLSRLVRFIWRLSLRPRWSRFQHGSYLLGKESSRLISEKSYGVAQMFEAARDLEFEKAAELRDLIRALEQKQIKYGSP